MFAFGVQEGGGTEGLCSLWKAGEGPIDRKKERQERIFIANADTPHEISGKNVFFFFCCVYATKLWSWEMKIFKKLVYANEEFIVKFVMF